MFWTVTYASLVFCKNNSCWNKIHPTKVSNYKEEKTFFGEIFKIRSTIFLKSYFLPKKFFFHKTGNGVLLLFFTSFVYGNFECENVFQNLFVRKIKKRMKYFVNWYLNKWGKKEFTLFFKRFTASNKCGFLIFFIQCSKIP